MSYSLLLMCILFIIMHKKLVKRRFFDQKILNISYFKLSDQLFHLSGIGKCFLLSVLQNPYPAEIGL